MLCRKLFFHDGKGVHAVYGRRPQCSVYAFIIQNIVFIFIQDTVTVPQKRRRTGVEKKLAEVVGFFPPADQEFDNINYEDMRGVGFDGGEVAEGGGEVAEEWR